MGSKAVFIDRDGTIAADVHYCRRSEDFELLPNSAEGIRLLNEHNLKVVVVTNQSGIARGYFTEETLAEIHRKMGRDLAEKGAFVDAIYYCPHHPDEDCDCRKPKPRMLFLAAQDLGIDLSRSYMIGDAEMDIEAGRRAGCRTLLIRREPYNPGTPSWGEGNEPDAIASDLLEAAQAIVAWEAQNQR